MIATEFDKLGRRRPFPGERSRCEEMSVCVVEKGGKSRDALQPLVFGRTDAVVWAKKVQKLDGELAGSTKPPPGNYFQSDPA